MAKSRDVSWTLHRHGANHEVSDLDGVMNLDPAATASSVTGPHRRSGESARSASGKGLVVLMVTYTATAERDGRSWLVHVSEVDRHTQARTLREIEPMARDLVAVMLDVEPASVNIDVQVRLPEDAAQHLDRARRLREEAAEANSAAARESRAAARALAGHGMPLRDIGAALGVSHQRAAQLLARSEAR
ncbi:MAG: hypothetical protein ACRCZD_06765 [Phycicoccus sp.]